MISQFNYDIQGKLVVNPVAKGVTSRDPSHDHVWQVGGCGLWTLPVSLISVSGYPGQLDTAPEGHNNVTCQQ